MTYYPPKTEKSRVTCLLEVTKNELRAFGVYPFGCALQLIWNYSGAPVGHTNGFQRLLKLFCYEDTLVGHLFRR
ncbi:unnamed protein product [Heterobilharzia americana]|nr:unnamed protein product [Heterobilharzia americana]